MRVYIYLPGGHHEFFLGGEGLLLKFCRLAAVQESRKHYNQLEEARKQQHKRKLKLEAQEVALGERDHVTATLGDNLYVGTQGSVSYTHLTLPTIYSV